MIMHDRKRSRRLIALLLLLAMLVGVACGGGDSGTIDSPEVKTQGDASAFIAAVDTRLDQVAFVADEAAAVLSNADVGSPGWRADSSAALHGLAGALDDAAALEAPDHMREQYEGLVSATTQYRGAAILLAAGIDAVDLDVIQAAAEQLADATVALAIARAELVG